MKKSRHIPEPLTASLSDFRLTGTHIVSTGIFKTCDVSVPRKDWQSLHLWCSPRSQKNFQEYLERHEIEELMADLEYTDRNDGNITINNHEIVKFEWLCGAQSMLAQDEMCPRATQCSITRFLIRRSV